jgi:two-component system response regulator (stage 0 sporulation protein F)
MRILVVDDEAIIRHLLTDVLKDDQHQVVAVENGKEAVDKVKDSPFDLIFSDVHMPVLNGLEMVKKIRTIDKNITIVMMDSFPDLLSELAQEEGAIACIHKPFELKEIREVLKNFPDSKKSKEEKVIA